METVLWEPMVATIRCPAIFSLFRTLSTPFLDMFPPKNYIFTYLNIFTYLKKESCSGSAQKLLGPLETDPGEPMVATVRCPPIFSLFRTLSIPFLDMFPPKNDIFTPLQKLWFSPQASRWKTGQYVT